MTSNQGSQQPAAMYEPGSGEQAAYSLSDKPPGEQRGEPTTSAAYPSSSAAQPAPNTAYPPPQQVPVSEQSQAQIPPYEQSTPSGAPPGYVEQQGQTGYPPEKPSSYDPSAARQPGVSTQDQGFQQPLEQQQTAQPPLTTELPEEDPKSLQYTRDPKRLTAYLVPFPHPKLKDAAASEKVPARFLIYTPPPPPIGAPPEGEKEGKVHKLQRKWQDEVREAKTNQAKVTSWKGAKGRATKGINWAMGQTKSSSLEFLNRVPGKSEEPVDKHSDDGVQEGETVKKTVGLEELLLFHPDTIQDSEDQIREQFINTMLRTQSKAQKDAIIATGLIPVSLAVDLLLTVIWPFGGLFEIDTVWSVASIRGAKTARSVTKRVNSSSPGEGGSAPGSVQKMMGKVMSKMPGQSQNSSQDDHQLRLRFVPLSRIEVMRKYLASECRQKNRHLFDSVGPAPTESEVVAAIGWEPSQTGGETKNWEDEQWELQEVKEDIRSVMHKGAREWCKWVKAYQDDPDKALKK
ncbi:MAG: hypothetical protein Q9162_005910 [Coniocarpon cinnabarinum]